MKNRFLKLFMITTLTVYMLVGCGGTETGEDNDAGTNTEANINSEADVNSGDDTTQIEYGVSNPDATYNETEYCYIVSDAAFVEEKYNDGTEFDRTNWNIVNTMIKLNAPISIYNPFKDIIGYMKTDVTLVYVSVDGEWSYLGFAEEVAKDSLYPNGGTYVRTDELKAVMEVIDGNNSSAIGEEDTEVTIEEMYVAIKAACDEAGLIYDESAFSSVNLTDFTTKSAPNGYAYMPFTMPIDNKDAAIPSFIEYLKDAIKIAQEDGFSGMNYILESVEIREPKYGEGSSKQYVFNLYLKFY